MESILDGRKNCFVDEFNSLGVIIIKLLNYATNFRQYINMVKGH